MFLSSFAKRAAAGVLIALLAAQAQVHAQSPTRTRLITASPSRAGQSVVITAEVDAFGSGGAPRGSVTFFDGATALGASPLNVLGTSQATLGAGVSQTCALTNAGGAQCWGWNSHGQLADGTRIDRATPVPVAGLASGVVQLTGGAHHTCALTSAGAVKCWGSNFIAQLGDQTDGDRLTPATVPGLSSSVVAIAAGLFHTCALKSAGGVICWGEGSEGQLGNGAVDVYSFSTSVSDPGTVYTALAASVWRSCGLTSAGAVKCWGDGFGALPVAVPGAQSGVAAITTGHYHGCALTIAGAVKCWDTNNPTAAPVAGLSSGVVAVSAGANHTCALLSTGGVRCWGSNSYGELGDGTTTHRSTPAPVASLGGFAVAITSGYAHSCALLSPSRTLRCWGNNEAGQLGDGTTTDRLLPVTVSSFQGLLHARTRRYAPLGVGVHQLRAVYSGDANHAASTSAVVPHEVR